MTDTPEKIWVFPCMGCTMLAADTEKQDGSFEYTRTDHHLALVAAAKREARNEALREAAYVARNACLVPPDGGSPTEAEAAVCEEAYNRILALMEDTDDE